MTQPSKQDTLTWHDRIQNYCERNNLTDDDNEFFSSLLTEAILQTAVPSTDLARAIYERVAAVKIAGSGPVCYLDVLAAIRSVCTEHGIELSTGENNP